MHSGVILHYLERKKNRFEEIIDTGLIQCEGELDINAIMVYRFESDLLFAELDEDFGLEKVIEFCLLVNFTYSKIYYEQT